MTYRSWLTVLAVLCLDQYTKHVVAATFKPNESRIVVPHVLWLTYERNAHGPLGAFGSSPVPLIVTALVVLAFFCLAFRDVARRSPAAQIALGAIVGGGLGNVVSRIAQHYIPVFVDLRWFPIFSLADLCITLGVVVLAWDTARRSLAARRNRGEDSRPSTTITERYFERLP